MSGVTPLRPDDVRSARAWAAFVADDAATAAPPSLEARVLRAAQAAIARKQQADAERSRHRWFAGLGALAATLLAAAAWSLAPADARPGATAPASPAPAIVARPPAAAPNAHRTPPMTNVEAGRMLATPPQALLASRPLFHVMDGAGLVGAPGDLRAKSFGAPTIEPVAVARDHGIGPKPPPALAGSPGSPEQVPAAVAGTAPEAWTTRGDQPVFDPEGTEVPAPAPVYRLEHATPVPPAREEPAAPPK